MGVCEQKFRARTCEMQHFASSFGFAILRIPESLPLTVLTLLTAKPMVGDSSAERGTASCGCCHSPMVSDAWCDVHESCSVRTKPLCVGMENKQNKKPWSSPWVV